MFGGDMREAKLSRREFLLAASALYVSLPCGCAHAFPNGLSDEEKNEIDKQHSHEGFGSQTGMNAAGCALTGSSAAAGDMSGMIIPYSAISPNLLEKAAAFHDFLKSTYQLAPALGFVNDANSPNAFATPVKLLSPLSHGTIMLGINLLANEYSKSPTGWEGAAAMIHAHEFGHIVQFASNISGSTPVKELQADALAGATLAHHIIVEKTLVQLPYREALKVAQRRNHELTQASKSLFSIGDYAFNSPSHHGTPNQRVRAFQSGFSMIANAPSTVPIPAVVNMTYGFAQRIYASGA